MSAGQFVEVPIKGVLIHFFMVNDSDQPPFLIFGIMWCRDNIGESGKCKGVAAVAAVGHLSSFPEGGQAA
ncbi:MAG: hypothetical protein ACOZE5_04905 [Verrucomicrobiota bacterium]